MKRLSTGVVVEHPPAAIALIAELAIGDALNKADTAVDATNKPAIVGIRMKSLLLKNGATVQKYFDTVNPMCMTDTNSIQLAPALDHQQKKITMSIMDEEKRVPKKRESGVLGPAHPSCGARVDAMRNFAQEHQPSSTPRVALYSYLDTDAPSRASIAESSSGLI
jgi:hypothetical protein